jgi:hypothetical protein
VNLLESFLLAVTVSWLTTQFSLRRFYRERWWEKKYLTYEGILNALHQMSQNVDAGRFLPNDELFGEDVWAKQLEKKFEDGKDEIRRIIALGEFIILPEVIEELQKIIIAPIGKTKGFDAYLDSFAAWGNGIHTCIEGVRQLARQDLNPTLKTRLRSLLSFWPDRWRIRFSGYTLAGWKLLGKGRNAKGPPPSWPCTTRWQRGTITLQGLGVGELR